MKNKFTLNFLAASTLLQSQAFAEVDLSNGSFIYNDNSTSLAMIYNSRSLHQGLLGFGWCTPLEDSLEVSNKTQLRLRDCRAGKIITFTLKANALRAPSSTTTKIYQSGDLEIEATESKFKLTKVPGSIQTFDRNGKLLEVKDERGKYARLLYDKNGFLKEVVSGRKDSSLDTSLNSSLQLKVDPRSGRLVEFQDRAGNLQGAGTRLTFLRGNLISVIKPRTAKYFSYDSVSNLIEVTDLEKVTQKNITVAYDSSDRVNSIKTSAGCSETYSYTARDLQNQTEVTTNCRGINNKRLVDFFYSKKSNGEILLERISSQNLSLTANHTTKKQLRSSRLPATDVLNNELEN